MAEQSKKKVAVVTGASRGIGRAIALELASRGAAVVINYNGSEERAREVQKEIEEKGGEAEIRQWNVADYKACESAVKDIVKTHGSIDILVNNAGITKDGLLMGMSEEDFDPGSVCVHEREEDLPEYKFKCLLWGPYTEQRKSVGLYQVRKVREGMSAAS